jgi:hypothetical protein
MFAWFRIMAGAHEGYIAMFHMFLFDLESIHKPILNPILHKTGSNNLGARMQ